MLDGVLDAGQETAFLVQLLREHFTGYTKFPAFRNLVHLSMDVVKLGKKGQVSIPKGVLTQLGLEGERLLLVETTPDGGILLRPAGVYPLETYSDVRVKAFLDEDRLSDDEAAQVRAKLAVHRS